MLRVMRACFTCDSGSMELGLPTFAYANDLKLFIRQNNHGQVFMDIETFGTSFITDKPYLVLRTKSVSQRDALGKNCPGEHGSKNNDDEQNGDDGGNGEEEEMSSDEDIA